MFTRKDQFSPHQAAILTTDVSRHWAPCLVQFVRVFPRASVEPERIPHVRESSASPQGVFLPLVHVYLSNTQPVSSSSGPSERSKSKCQYLQEFPLKCLIAQVEHVKSMADALCHVKYSCGGLRAQPLKCKHNMPSATPFPMNTVCPRPRESRWF